MHAAPEDPTPALDDLLRGLRALLGARLVGLYLYGSHVSGWADEISDLDLLAALTGDLTDDEVARLERLHAGIVRDYPAWDDRIEVAYLSLAGLQTFRERPSRMGIISPGEPLHLITAGADWLMNWYLVRTGGRTLFGPPPETIIPPISHEEFIASIRAHARAWPTWVEATRDRHAQAYAVLTMCRTLYTHRTGQHVGKREAANWAAAALPEWAPLIAAALVSRHAPKSEQGDPERTYPETVRFVREIAALVGNE